MNTRPLSAADQAPVAPGSSFYEKAAGMLLAAGAATTVTDAAVVFWQGAGVIDTGNIAPGGETIALKVGIGTVFSSTAYGFVKGVGNLSLPTDSLSGFFRQAGAPFVGAGNEFGPSSGSIRFLTDDEDDPIITNNAELSGDNLFGFSFVSGAINGGAPVYGWARVFISPDDESTQITAWAYDDSGASIQLGVIPEPSGLALLAAGAAGGVACFHRFRRRQDEKPTAG